MRGTKDISARALLFLDAQHLPPTPQNYWLAFTVEAGIDEALAKALGPIIDGGVRLTQAQADALCERYLGGAATAGNTAAAANTIRHQTLHLADLAASATTTTGEFSRDLAYRLPSIATADAESLQRLVVATIERSQRTECELAATSAKVEQLRHELEAVQNDAERDALTRLPNRRGIEAHIAAARQTGERLFIAMCDIDRFKSYNDRFGHAVGDRVLKTVAQSLVESLPDHFVGRWGGEEFLVVGRTGTAAAVALLEAAKTALGDRHFKLRETDEPMGRISFSAGVTALVDGETVDQALERADRLLYRAKNEGRDRVIGP